MPDDASPRGLAWALFDEIVANAPDGNPWTGGPDGVHYQPDLMTLGLLMAVPVRLRAPTQSGVPALALDVWLAHEFRRAGIDPDALWPRHTAPRVLPVEVSRLIANLPAKLRSDVRARVLDNRGLQGVGGSNANILGKNYVKQVDVGFSTWQTGPQLLVSTKRMDTALGKNAANRVEESYGDAKNLRLRYPRAALGFLYALRGAAIDREAQKANWLIDLLGKLGEEDDAYDAWVAAGLNTEEPDAGRPVADPEAARLVEGLVPVTFRHDAVPEHLAPGRFLEILLGKVLANTPVDFHDQARRLRADASRYRLTTVGRAPTNPAASTATPATRKTAPARGDPPQGERPR